MIVETLTERQGSLDLSPFNWSDDIRVKGQEYREKLQKLAIEANADNRFLADWFTAFGSEVASDGAKNLVKPTSFHMTSGQMRFLKSVLALAEGLQEDSTDAFKEAIFGPWTYQDTEHSLGWDPNTERMAALRHISPSKDKKFRSVRAAVWLAAESLPLFPTVPVETIRGLRLETTGFKRQNRDYVFRWPVWEPPITVDTLKCLLASRFLHNDPVDRIDLARRGVVAVYQSVQYRFGQGYGIFRPAAMVS
jgi:hypothetical protein